jgi:hypothetical protein|tara:strand:- start:1921 stop:2412 length:492 start_codon:yes stop_codon:yes gene_type:complete
MATKTHYFQEVSIPDSVKNANADKDAVDILVGLLDQYIDSTNEKNAKSARDFIMDKKRGYAWSEDAPNKGAFGLTFMNSRHYKQYLTLIAGFRAWAKANHNIDFTYKIAKKVPYDGYTNPKLLNVPTPDSDSENSYNDTYENVGEKFIFEHTAKERGFVPVLK